VAVIAVAADDNVEEPQRRDRQFGAQSAGRIGPGDEMAGQIVDPQPGVEVVAGGGDLDGERPVGADSEGILIVSPFDDARSGPRVASEDEGRRLVPRDGRSWKQQVGANVIVETVAEVQRVIRGPAREYGHVVLLLALIVRAPPPGAAA